MIKGIDRDEIKARVDKILDSFYMSPSAMKRLDTCQAYYVLDRIIFPKIEPDDTKQFSILGRTFHSIAENEFSNDSEKEELADDTDKVKSKVSAMKNNVKSRDYFQYEAENEKELRIPLRNLGDVFGIIDRFIPFQDESGKRCMIVDYKTTSNINPDNEMRQMLTYAWLAWKKLGYDPKDITIILDYVSEPEPFVYNFSQYDLETHENFMVSRFKLARKLLTEFRDNLDMKKLVYCPGGGSCSFCPLTGSCLPYTMWINPGLGTDDVSFIKTIDLIGEKIKLDELSKIYTDRVKTINRTLLMRHKMNIPEPDDPEGRTSAEIIAGFMHKIESSGDEYNTREVMSTIIEDKTKKVVKKLGLIDNIDLQELNTILTDLVTEQLPARIGSEKVPENVAKKLSRSRFIKTKAPYLRYKK